MTKKVIILGQGTNAKTLAQQCAIHGVVRCAECKERDLIEEAKREKYLHNLRWEENMNHLYTRDEGGFCDGFTNQ